MTLALEQLGRFRLSPWRSAELASGTKKNCFQERCHDTQYNGTHPNDTQHKDQVVSGDFSLLCLGVILMKIVMLVVVVLISKKGAMTLSIRTHSTRIVY
jgi:hypothetical protein